MLAEEFLREWKCCINHKPALIFVGPPTCLWIFSRRGSHILLKALSAFPCGHGELGSQNKMLALFIFFLGEGHHVQPNHVLAVSVKNSFSELLLVSLQCRTSSTEEDQICWFLLFTLAVKKNYRQKTLLWMFSSFISC